MFSSFLPPNRKKIFISDHYQHLNLYVFLLFNLLSRLEKGIEKKQPSSSTLRIINKVKRSHQRVENLKLEKLLEFNELWMCLVFFSFPSFFCLCTQKHKNEEVWKNFVFKKRPDLPVPSNYPQNDCFYEWRRRRSFFFDFTI